MIALLSLIFTAIINILPLDPIQIYIKTNIGKLNFLPYLNWVVPFDNCLVITDIWLTAIIAYYLYDAVKGIVYNFIIKKLFE